MSNPRALRATELAKQFSLMGHKVVVYAVLGSYNYDEFEKKHKNIKVKDIGKLVLATRKSDGTSSKNIIKRILNKAFKTLLDFPNSELMFKIPSIIREERGMDVLITIGAPHSLHWGAALAKKLYYTSFPKKWLADCGDPFMGNEFEPHYFYFKYLEKWFCKEADNITVPVVGAIKGYYPEFHSKIRIIPQGFSFEDLPKPKPIVNNKVSTFAYAGSFYGGNRDPTTFLEFLCSLKEPFKFIVYTRNLLFLEPYLGKLGDKIEVRDYIPRTELLNILSTVDFVINLENGTNVQTPSKLIDYALLNKPILSLNPKAPNFQKIKEFLKGDFTNKLVIEDIEQYNIENVAHTFLELAK